jgi:hypothetical protein
MNFNPCSQICTLVAFSTLTIASACKTSPSKQAAAQPSASIVPRPLALAVVQKPWFSGSFVGNYEAKLSPVEVKAGAAREWAADDGKLASGPGKLELTVDDQGLVDGASEGALGASHATGKVEGDTLSVVLTPDQSSGMRGVLVASRDNDGFRGSIAASSGDSLRVRQAAVELRKQNP